MAVFEGLVAVTEDVNTELNAVLRAAVEGLEVCVELDSVDDRRVDGEALAPEPLKELLWVIGGESKQRAVQQFLNNAPSIPATLPTQARATVLLDQAAAG